MGVTNIIPDEFQKVAARYFGDAYTIVVAVYDKLDVLEALYTQVDAQDSIYTNMETLLNIYENIDLLGEANTYITTVNIAVDAANSAAASALGYAEEAAANKDVAVSTKNAVLASQQTVLSALAEVQATADIVSSIVDAIPYEALDPYQFPAVVIGSNGFSYRCTSQTDIVGIDPVGDITGTWVQLNGLVANDNLLINSEFYINSENYDADGIAELTAGQYGHDMWKVEGGVLVYTKGVSDTVTINSITGTTGAEIMFTQKNDKMLRFAGKQAVISIMVTQVGDSMTLFADGASVEISSPGVYNLKYSISTGKIGLKATIPATGTYTLNFAFEQFKVELGSAFTAWKAQDYDTVLRACQKYLYTVKTATVQAFLGHGGGDLILMPTPCKMNTVHTVLFNDLELLNLTTSAQTLLGLSATVAMDSGVMLDCIVAEDTRGPSILQSRYPDGMIKLDARY